MRSSMAAAGNELVNNLRLQHHHSMTPIALIQTQRYPCIVTTLVRVH
jgi:hypothetical protein